MLRTIFLLSLFIPASVYAGVYKWVDEDGNTHYGDRPAEPDKVQAVEMDAQFVESGVSSERAERREKLLEVMKEDRLEKQRLREAQQAERSRRAKECARLKKRYERYRHASGVYRKDGDGNRSYLSNEERGEAEAKYRKRIAQVCG